MAEMIVLEVLEKSGKVRERVRLGSFPVRVGRAYDNDIILDDEYVSPHHLIIGKDDQGELRIADLDSENGLYQLPSRKQVSGLPVAADNHLLLGHTHIRIRRPDFDVAPTIVNNRKHQKARDLLAHGWLFSLLVLLVSALWWSEKYFLSFHKIKYEELILTVFSPMLVLLIWSGIWAFVGRILVHRAAYITHINMVLLFGLSLFGLAHFQEYFSFAFSAEELANLIEALAITLAGGILLYGHLHLATQLKRKAIAITSTLVVSSLLGITLFSNYIEDTRFNSSLIYPSALRPASSMIGEPLTSDAFLSSAQSMKSQLDKARLEDSY